MNILLIEDNLADIELTKEAVNGNINMTLNCINNGEDAILSLETEPFPSLIILDLNLPKMNGKEVLRIIKSNIRTKKIPIIIFSTSDSEEEILKCYNFHANCYIKKPIDFNKFKKILKDLESFWFSTATLPDGNKNEK